MFEKSTESGDLSLYSHIVTGCFIPVIFTLVYSVGVDHPKVHLVHVVNVLLFQPIREGVKEEYRKQLSEAEETDIDLFEKAARIVEDRHSSETTE